MIVSDKTDAQTMKQNTIFGSSSEALLKTRTHALTRMRTRSRTRCGCAAAPTRFSASPPGGASRDDVQHAAASGSQRVQSFTGASSDPQRADWNFLKQKDTPIVR